MKTCPTCQMSNEDSAAACVVCGSTLPAAPKKKSGAGKKLLAIAGGFALAAALAAGAAAGVKAWTGGGLDSAYKAAVTSLTGQFTQKPNAGANLRRLESIRDSGQYAMQLALSDGLQDLSLTLDYSKRANALTGQLGYSGTGGLNLNMAYYANKKTVQLIPSGDSLHVYGFSVKDFQKKFDQSPLFRMLPVSLPEISLLDLLKAEDLDTLLNKASNGAYRELKKTFAVEKQGKRILTLNGTAEEYKIYRVTWDSRSLADFLKDMDSAKVFSGLTALLGDLLTKVEPDCYLYLDGQGNLSVADFVAVGTQYKLSLKGTQNPWEDMALTAKRLDGTSRTYTGGIVTAGDVVTLALEAEGESLLSVVYDDSTGRFSLDTKKREAALEGCFRETDSGVALELYFRPGGGEEQRIILEMEHSKSKPKKFSDTYTDLFSLGLNDIQRLLMDVGLL